MKFKLTDLDESMLDNSVNREAPGIIANNTDGRSDAQVLTDTQKGHAAEVYLRQYQGYTENPRKYHDLIDSNNNETEVKVVPKYIKNLGWVESDPNDININKWTKAYIKNGGYNYARKLVVFTEENGEFEYYRTFDLETQTDWVD